MNLHPIFVHFPVALLSVYAIFELLRFKRVQNLPHWFYTKATFLIVGTVSGFVAYQSGEAIEGQFRKLMGQLIEAHSAWAAFTLVIFGTLSLGYLAQWILREIQVDFKYRNTVSSVSQFIVGTSASWILAVIGLIAVSITGALGGAMAYGPDIDLFVRFVVNLLRLNG